MSLIRNTIFALLMAVEQDLRRLCLSEAGTHLLLTDAERDAGVRRRTADGKEGETSVAELVDYLDIGQLLDVLQRNRKLIVRSLGWSAQSLEALIRALRTLVPIRNRVCHARPLEPEDLVQTVEVADLLSKPELLGTFVELSDVRSELQHRSDYPMTLEIPAFWSLDVREVDHNLPVPEWDDTGFVGRASDRTNVLALINGPHPVVTITGEGGVGKTALAVRCLYDLVDKTSEYDAIVWTSLKASRLTTEGIRTIIGSMTSEIDVLASLAQHFGSGDRSGNLDQLIGNVLEIMETFRVMVVIDNMETIDRDALRQLFMSIPRSSKLILTSRIGIGEFEVRYPLKPLNSRDAIDLVRRTARILNVADLFRRTDDELAAMAARLYHSPLAIRWYVQSYSEGRTKNLLDRSRDLDELLAFCFQNLYETLTPAQTRILRILVALGTPLSDVQLALLVQERDIETIRTSLQHLYSSNLLLRSRDSWSGQESSVWAVSEFARQYIMSRDKGVSGERLRVLPAYRALMSARDATRAKAAGSKFGTRVIDARTTNQAMVVRSLLEALDASFRQRPKDALEYVATAQSLLPEFYEVWRVSAQVKVWAGDVIGATDDFERAIELADGESETLLVFYADFLISQELFDHAVQVLEAAAKRPDAAVELVASYGWALNLAGRPKDAVEIFGDIHREVFELYGRARSAYLTQYADALRRAAEVENSRGLSKSALQYALRGLALIHEAIENRVADDKMVRAAQYLTAEACKAISARCDLVGWRQFVALGLELAETFDLAGAKDFGVNKLRDTCHQIATSKEFGVLFPRHKEHQAPDAPPNLFGTVRTIGYGRDFGFVVADDNLEYFLHRGQFVGPVTWEELARLARPRVSFQAGPEPAIGKLPYARNVQLITV